MLTSEMLMERIAKALERQNELLEERNKMLRESVDQQIVSHTDWLEDRTVMWKLAGTAANEE